MDKYEYKVRSEEISNLIDSGKYIEAVSIADTIDWRRVKSVTMLLKISALYRVNRRNEVSREILMLAYEHYPTNRSVVYALCELSIELDDVVAAVEYYKQFVKLAPKDNGVYTLRYRILEAQEASLEERIAILEELKRRDYQEEWAYELAYLYHRVGLTTKCIEECDDIILWFGEGPYVMKAMELKALHMPLTEIQQAKYNSMLNHAEEDYIEEDYGTDDYDGNNYIEENDSVGGYQNEYGFEGGSSETPDMETYGNESYFEEDYNEAEPNVDETHLPDGYMASPYENGEYGQAGYAEEAYGNAGYAPDGYAEETYENAGYAPDGYAEEPYGNAGYAPDGYAEEPYGNAGYAPDGYTGGAYGNEEYSPNNYVDDGYGNLSYVGDFYPDNGYTGGGFAEQAYDEGGAPIDAQAYADSNPADGSFGDSDYTNESYGGNNYTDDGYAPDSYAAPQNYAALSKNAVDMSQYNTINLQKVVAESMKELFPDDDVFEEEREKFSIEESIVDEELNKADAGGVSGDTIIYTNLFGKSDAQTDTENYEIFDNALGAADEVSHIVKNPYSDADSQDYEKETQKSKETAPDSESIADDPTMPEEPDAQGSLAGTGRIARIVTGVSETAPEPHTGSISKVFVPGEDARFMKAESNIDELRDTTERAVSEEHKRIADSGENVYHPQSIMDTEEKAAEENLEQTPQKQPTNPMNLNDVLEEWERMKLDNARKHQEEIKQHVLTQTGKILANFDNSIKSGILGELELEESESGEKSPSGENETLNTPSKEAEQESDNDFDIAYTSNTEPPKENEEKPRKEYLSKLERVVAQELGGLTQDLPQSDIENLTGKAGHEESAEAADNYNEETVQAQEDRDETVNAQSYKESEPTQEEGAGYYEEGEHTENLSRSESDDTSYSRESGSSSYYSRRYTRRGRKLDPEDEASIAEMAKEDALKTQEIKMSTADLSSLSDKIVAATKKEAKGAKREEIRDFTPEEQTLFENFAVTKKIKKQIVFALDNITLAAYTGNVIITGDAGLDAVRMAKNLLKEYHAADANFSGKVAKITGEKINQRNLKDVFDKLNNGGIIIEKANGMSEQKLYEMATLLNQDNLGIVIIMEDTKKEITRLLGKQAMIADYFNIRIDLMEMDMNALVAYAKNYALALEYSIDELGTLALYTRIANMQSGNHVVTKDEVRDIVDEAIWKSKKSKIKNFVDVLFARRYDGEDMIVLKERDFI